MHRIRADKYIRPTDEELIEAYAQTLDMIETVAINQERPGISDSSAKELGDSRKILHRDLGHFGRILAERQLLL